MSLNDYTDMTKMGLRDDIQDAPGKEPVVVKQLSGTDLNTVESVKFWCSFLQSKIGEYQIRHLSAPVEAALHDFSMGLDDLIKETLGKVRDDQ